MCARCGSSIALNPYMYLPSTHTPIVKEDISSSQVYALDNTGYNLFNKNYVTHI